MCSHDVFVKVYKMTKCMPPKFLVVDDDINVIAAYRAVLEHSRQGRLASSFIELIALEHDLFDVPSTHDVPPQWKVIYVDQGLSAIAEFHAALNCNQPFTAVFLDMRMPPGIDGYETAHYIRQMDKTVPIVITTAYADYTHDDYLKVAGPSGLLHYLSKPIWPEHLQSFAHMLSGQPSYQVVAN
jgi:CheY-like chemotaxis protein